MQRAAEKRQGSTKRSNGRPGRVELGLAARFFGAKRAPSALLHPRLNEGFKVGKPVLDPSANLDPLQRIAARTAPFRQCGRTYPQVCCGLLWGQQPIMVAFHSISDLIGSILPYSVVNVQHDLQILAPRVAVNVEN